MSAADERERVRLAMRQTRNRPSFRSRENLQRLAYARADRRLRELYRTTFDRFYAEEKHSLGLTERNAG